MNHINNLRVLVARDRRYDPFGDGLFLILKQAAHPDGEGGAVPAICTNI